jgi:AcrR family transcriptional regulator
MRTAGKTATRPYLSAPARREQLLAAAGRLVREGGWTALSMQRLAAAAGVSRQLVYEHFSGVDDLSIAVLIHLFERAYEATAAIVRTDAAPDVVLRDAYELYLDLPAEERRALRALANESGRVDGNLTLATQRMRARIAELWLPYVRRYTELAEPDAIALAWMLITASWSLADSIAEGALSRERGVDMFVRFAIHTLSSWRMLERAPT